MKFRLTKQRKIILEELGKLKTHPTADQVYELVRQRIPRISLGTVYRNLNILSEAGLIQPLVFGNHQRRFDGNPEMHYHALCVHCGRVEDVPARNVFSLDSEVMGISGWEIVRHSLKFFGVCPECRGKRNVSLKSESNPKERRSEHEA